MCTQVERVAQNPTLSVLKDTFIEMLSQNLFCFLMMKKIISCDKVNSQLRYFVISYAQRFV